MSFLCDVCHLSVRVNFFFGRKGGFREVGHGARCNKR